MARTIVDSDYLIDILRGVPGVAEALAELAVRESVGTTTVTLFELMRGTVTDADKAAVGQLIGHFEVLQFDASAAVAAAELWQALRRAGTSIDSGDTLIAGISLSRGLRLLTRNVSDFGRIPGLQLMQL